MWNSLAPASSTWCPSPLADVGSFSTQPSGRPHVSNILERAGQPYTLMHAPAASKELVSGVQIFTAISMSAISLRHSAPVPAGVPC